MLDSKLNFAFGFHSFTTFGALPTFAFGFRPFALFTSFGALPTFAFGFRPFAHFTTFGALPTFAFGFRPFTTFVIGNRWIYRRDPRWQR